MSQSSFFWAMMGWFYPASIISEGSHKKGRKSFLGLEVCDLQSHSTDCYIPELHHIARILKNKNKTKTKKTKTLSL
jgi:hypothetical protein